MDSHTFILTLTTFSGKALRKCALLVLAAVLACATVRGALTDGLVSYWPLDVDQGGTTPDLSFGNTMLVGGTATVSAGMFSNAFTFNGSSAWLTNLHTFNSADTGLPIFQARTYTIAMWLKGTPQTARYIFCEGNSTTATPIFILQTGQVAANSNKLDVILRTSGNQTLINHAVSANVVFDDTWHHIAWVDDRGKVSLFIDGELDAASSNFNYDATYNNFDFDVLAIGTLVRTTISAANSFNGQIDEVAIWERALSQDEVNAVRTNGVYTPGTPVPPRPATLTRVPVDVVKSQGDWHLFSVDAAGNRPLTYQWSSNGVPIPGATTRSYQAVGLQTDNTGDYYSCSVANAHNLTPAVSSNATLTVLADPAPALADALVNYWPLDVFNENTNSPDLHYGHNMQMVNVSTNFDILPGQFSNSVFFIAAPAPGSFGYRVGGTPVYSRTNYSVSLWVNGDGNGQNDRRVFSEGRSAANNNPLFTLGTDNTGLSSSATAFVRSDGGVSSAMTGRKSTRPVFDNTWHLLVWTDDNGKGKLYIDGVLDETDYTYGRPSVTLDLTYIGVTARTTAANVPAPVTPYTGFIDEVATWNRVLTWTEIQMIMTNGVPVPDEVVLPPVITSQPQDRTNNVFVGDIVNFNVGVNGSPPLDYQWRKDGTPISGAINPSAISDTLSLTNVQLIDSNTTYSVVVSNPSGSVTSSVVRLYVSPLVVITQGEVLSLDVGLTGSSNPQPGFSEFTLGQNPASYNGGVKVTISGIGAPLAERNRVTGNMAVNNPPDMTQAQIYNDFIFANNGTGDGTGMSILIERLATNITYGLTFWSFDPQSGGTRVSDWTETASGVPLPIVTDHTFDGRVLPTNNFQYAFGGLVTSSAAGTLQLEGLRKSTSVGTDGVTPSFGVFVNGFRLVANPTGTRITGVQLVNGNLRITVEGDYPGQPIFIHQATELTSGNWTDSGATPVETRGPVAIFEIPVSADQIFYRSVSYPTW